MCAAPALNGNTGDEGSTGQKGKCAQQSLKGHTSTGKVRNSFLLCWDGGEREREGENFIAQD